MSIKARSFNEKLSIFIYFLDGQYFSDYKCVRAIGNVNMFDWKNAELFTGLKDKLFNEIYVNNIVEGYWGYMKGDGYLKKGVPDKIRKRFRVVLGDGRNAEAGFALEEIGVHPEDQKFAEQYFYRAIYTSLREARECMLKDNEVVWLGRSDSLTIIGDCSSRRSKAMWGIEDN